VACTAHQEAVASRGHRIKRVELPIVVSDEVESVSKTSELVNLLEKIGLKEELQRLYDGVKRNSGHSRLRGRSYREKVGPLLIVTNDRGVGRTAQSIPGVEVARVDSLNLLELAPGGVPGRLTMWTESSLTALPPLRDNDRREVS
jgi:large subunit ribosomal protein L4e